MPHATYDYDIFISYAHIDNETLTKEQQGWIDMLHDALDLYLGQLLGEKPRIWRDPKLQGNDYFGEEIVDELMKAALLVSVLSPRYVNSRWCMEELQKFLETAEGQGGVRIGNKSRILKVVKTDIPLEKHPADIRGLLGYEFFEVDPQTGRPREFMGFGREPNPEYWAKLDDLAYDIRQLLELLKSEQPPPAPTGVTVYLAETTSDLKDARDQIRRELQVHGHTVLPDQPLPQSGPNLETVVRENLERCALSIHLIGAHYGVVPEKTDRSTVEIQHALSATHSQQDAGFFSRIVWLPGDLQIDEDRQTAFVKDLLDGAGLRRGDELLRTTLEELKTTIRHKLSVIQSTSEGSGTGEDAPDGLTRIYLIYDRADAGNILRLKDYLYDRGFEVLTPLFDGDETDLREEHQENLRICDAALIYYGDATEAWMRGKLRDLRKAPAYREAVSGSTQIATKALYVAAPEDAQKAGFRTREVSDVIRNFGDFSPDDLRPFLDRLPETTGGVA